MTSSEPYVRTYELLDFGGGRKLERFGPWTLDRPSPAAEAIKPRTNRWQCDARFHRDIEPPAWELHTPELTLDIVWKITSQDITFQLKLTEFGHVGIFPEQEVNWKWLTDVVRREHGGRSEPMKLLNLFAYTGGSTLAAAHAGAEVTHIDSARNVVQWARENARLSGLADAPIRWIVEDAAKFAQRELRRGRYYDGVICDPPAYGHGPKGERWKIERDLGPLLETCAELTRGEPRLLLITCHSQGYGPREIRAAVKQAFSVKVGASELGLLDSAGRTLNAGVVLRYFR